MNSYILRKIFLLSLTVMMCACTTDEGVLFPENQSNVKLELELVKHTRSGARSDVGVDELNENVVQSVDLFLYQKGGALNNEQPVFVAKDVDVSSLEDARTQIEFFLPKDKFNTLFPTEQDTQCDIYIIANRSTENTMTGDNVLPKDQSISSLKNMVLYASSMGTRVEDEQTGLYKPGKEPSFVMDGMATISRSGKELSGTVPVERVASKISLVIQGIADEVTDDNGVVWLSDKKSVRLSFRRGCNRTKLGVTPTDYLYTAQSEDIFHVDAISLDQIEGTDYLTTSVPFYTYPTNWENNENTRSHFILMIQWVKKENPDEKQLTFYEVNINPAGTHLKRNTHYKINQKVEVLGSTEAESPKELYPSNYLILDWGNQNSEANLSRFKYLMVDETAVTLDNVENKRIYFFSSDPIILADVNVSWDYLKYDVAQSLLLATKNHMDSSENVQGDKIYVVENTNAVPALDNDKNNINVTNRINGNYKLTIIIHNGDKKNPNDPSYIEIIHPLNNSMDNTADFSKYSIDLTVTHQDDNNYSESIDITQYPMLSIVAMVNSDYVDDGVVNNNDNNYKGYVYINGAQNSSGTTWAQIGGLPENASINQNPNKYIVSITSLVDTDIAQKYIIGDPRSTTVRNPSNIYSGNGNTLTYYYPTDRKAVAQLISPQFMVASSYGYCPQTINNIDDAERRCATYQEDGYPAGRWRVPTQAEVQYIIQHSEWGSIPKLFSNQTWYWSAQGSVQYTGNGNFNVQTSASGRVRCVYDTWYWGTGQLEDKTVFTYGDKER